MRYRRRRSLSGIMQSNLRFDFTPKSPENAVPTKPSNQKPCLLSPLSLIPSRIWFHSISSKIQPRRDRSMPCQHFLLSAAAHTYTHRVGLHTNNTNHSRTAYVPFHSLFHIQTTCSFCDTGVSHDIHTYLHISTICTYVRIKYHPSSRTQVCIKTI